ncbi:MAG: helix-turn-helix domain-containing protein [Jatrophihabitans sp.]
MSLVGSGLRPAPTSDQPALGRAAQLVQDARRRAGLTQEQVAAVGGIAVRTLRSMESGSGRRPRRSSVLQVCAVLDLDYAGRTELLSLYGLAAERADLSFPYTRRQARPNLIDTTIREIRSSLETVSISGLVVVGSGGAGRHETEDRLVTARADGVDRTFAFCDPDPEIGCSDITISPTSGCTVGARTHIPGSDIILFEILFTRSLQRGESYTFSYQLDYRLPEHDQRRAHRSGPVGGFNGYVLTDKVDIYTTRVRFEAQEPPPGCYQIFRHRPGEPILDVRQLAVASGEVQLVLRNPRRGSHGIRWAW